MALPPFNSVSETRRTCIYCNTKYLLANTLRNNMYDIRTIYSATSLIQGGLDYF